MTKKKKKKSSYIWIRNEKEAVPEGERVTIIRPDYNIIVTDTLMGEGVVIWSNVNIYGAEIGPGTKISSFVEIRTGAKIGKNVKIQPFVVIPEGVEIGDCVFVGPYTIISNDLLPRACNEEGDLVTEYTISKTKIEDFAMLGAGSIIRGGVTLGRGCLIGMGAIVTFDVPPKAVVYGEKARIRKFLH